MNWPSDSGDQLVEPPICSITGGRLAWGFCGVMQDIFKNITAVDRMTVARIIEDIELIFIVVSFLELLLHIYGLQQ